MYNPEDTIVALSSAKGAALRGIVRLSGPLALECVERIFEANEGGDLDFGDGGGSWCCYPGRFRLREGVSVSGQLYVFRQGNSYTCQDMAELHLPGCPGLLQMVIENLLGDQVRPAEPGEFTARAFFNGRIDLTEAEAVAQLINARSDEQLRAAERLMEGRLHRICSELSEKITELLALVEAGIDFSEEDIEFATQGQLLEQLEEVVKKLERLIADSLSWNELEHLPQVVVAGLANAGKSTLTNALLKMDRSITSNLAGTTRDLLTAPLKVGDGECMLVDTAGLGEVSDPLAYQTQRVSEQAVAGCDMLLWVVDVSKESFEADCHLFGSLKSPKETIIVANKMDLCAEDLSDRLWRLERDFSFPVVAVSALAGESVDVLAEEIAETLQLSKATGSGESIALTGRQRQGLMGGLAGLHAAIKRLTREESFDEEILALDLREALDQLGSISGQVVTEDVLDVIFSKFCIGK